MGADIEVEASQTVTAEAVGAALEDDGGGVIGAYARADNVLEELGIGEVVDAVIEGHVEGVVRSRIRVWFWACGVERACAGEVDCFFVLMEGKGHDSIGRPEGLLDAITMVNVNIDVEDTRVVQEELEDREDDVIYVAESRRFRFFRVMKTTRPVNCDIRLVRREFSGCVQGSACVKRTIAVEAIEDRTIIAHIIGITSAS